MLTCFGALIHTHWFNRSAIWSFTRIDNSIELNSRQHRITTVVFCVWNFINNSIYLSVRASCALYVHPVNVGKSLMTTLFHAIFSFWILLQQKCSIKFCMFLKCNCSFNWNCLSYQFDCLIWIGENGANGKMNSETHFGVPKKIVCFAEMILC